jgi:hypothetical protein
MTQAVIDGTIGSADGTHTTAYKPGLAVSVGVRSSADGAVVRVRVAGAQGPFRVYVYADGDLVEAWIPGGESNEFVCRALGAGRHTVTARAIDAAGRWGGASTLYGTTLHATPRSAASSRDRAVRCTAGASGGA